MRRDMAYPTNIETPPYTRREIVKVVLGTLWIAFWMFIGLFLLGVMQ